MGGCSTNLVGLMGRRQYKGHVWWPHVPLLGMTSLAGGKYELFVVIT
jgi:hypothetical protein